MIDLGLKPDGSLELDFGARIFTARLDEDLVPFIVDASGERLRKLPKPSAADDVEKAKRSVERFKTLTKDAKIFASERVAQLEAAMCARKRWSADEFHASIVTHPLLVQLARRLVWRDASSSFRIAEDGTYVTADDARVMPGAAPIELPHPIDLDATTLAAWTDHFARYEHIQPFEQVTRQIFSLTSDERGTRELARFRGKRVTTSELRELEQRGWRKGPRVFISRTMAASSDLHARFAVNEREGSLWSLFKEESGISLELPLLGLLESNRKDPLHHVLGAVFLAGVPGHAPVVFDALPHIMASELLRDLTRLEAVH